MSAFWELDVADERPAFVEAEGPVTSYGALRALADRAREALPERGRKRLGFLFGWNAPGPIAAYLAALRGHDAVFVGNPRLDLTLRAGLVEQYRPDWIALPAGDAEPSGYRRLAWALDPHQLALFGALADAEGDLHPELALLLSTSGTTGSPKLVRLTRANVQANAASIASYLGLHADERAITSLPFQYSYGLSVVNSHLLAGGSLILTDRALVEKEFWSALSAGRATSLAGVPFSYATLERLRFDPARQPTLRTLTQAGGRLDVRLQEHFEHSARRAGMRFFVMYGQTEATARISYVPPDALARKLGSIGVAIPGGELSLDPATGEILYRGPNVMQGYAGSRADLVRGDECAGLLRTGDLGKRDEDGFFFITGRLKRFVKLFGHRVNLDELESALGKELGEPVACHGIDDRLVVLLESEAHMRDAEQLLLVRYAVSPGAFRVIAGQGIPRTDSGKVDYPAILARHLSP